MTELYYSNRCKHSNQLIQKINEYQIGPMITPVCIDNNFPRHLIGKITRVPTIVSNGTLYVGEDSFRWVEQIQKMKFRKQQQGPADQSSNQQTQHIERPKIEPDPNEGIMGSDSFYGGVGLGYSSSDLTGNAGENHNSLYEMYESLDGSKPGDSNLGIDLNTTDANSGAPQSQKKQEVDKAYEDLLAQRQM